MANQNNTTEWTGAIHPNNLSMVDMRKSCLRIGMKTENAEWLELDGDDWRILHALLNKPLVNGESAASTSPALKLLSDWTEQTLKWCE